MRLVTLTLLLFVLFIPQLQAQIEKDKIAHFGMGVLSGGAGAFVASEISNQNRFWTFTGAVAGSLLAGLAKEALDERSESNSWDNADLGATVLGGITVGITIELVSKKDGKRYRGGKNKMSSDQAITPTNVFLLMDADFNNRSPVNIHSDE